MTIKLICSILLLSSISIPALHAQDQQTPAGTSSSGVNLVARTTMAVNYRRGETTHVDLKGTDLMPDITGEVKVINKSGLTDIHVDVENLRLAKNVDLAYLTYVLWTVSP